MSFGDERFLWVAGATALALTVAFALDHSRRRRALDRIGHAPMLGRMMMSLSSRRRVVKVVLLTAASTLVIAALARPQVRGESTWRQRGIDIAIVMDYSKSMLATDTYPSRFSAMLNEIELLGESLEADRVAPVVFAGAAVHFPLTHDHAAARLLYAGISPADMAPGSDLGEAFLVARCILRPDVADASCDRVGGRGHGGDPLQGESDGEGPRAQDHEVADRGRAIIVFTDGEDTEGRARFEVEQAVKLGIEVYIVAVGTPAGELIPELGADGKTRVGWKKAEDGSFVTTRLDQSGLKELAEIAGGEGHYYWLEPKAYEREDLIRELQSLKKGDLDQRVMRKPKEVYQWLLFPAFLLLLIEACMGERRRRVSHVGGER